MCTFHIYVKTILNSFIPTQAKIHCDSDKHGNIIFCTDQHTYNMTMSPEYGFDPLCIRGSADANKIVLKTASTPLFVKTLQRQNGVEIT